MASIKSLLIVEDEPLIAMLLEDFARSLGFDVVGGAESVDGALECVAAGGFDGAILDVNLRGGRESWPVADALAERAIPFVLATGGHIAPPPARHANAPTLMKRLCCKDWRQSEVGCRSAPIRRLLRNGG